MWVWWEVKFPSYLLLEPSILMHSVRYCKHLELHCGLYCSIPLTNTPTVCPRALKRIHEGDLASLPVEAHYACVFFVRCFFLFSFQVSFSHILWLTIKLGLFPWDHFELLSLLRYRFSASSFLPLLCQVMNWWIANWDVWSLQGIVHLIKFPSPGVADTCGISGVCLPEWISSTLSESWRKSKS